MFKILKSLEKNDTIPFITIELKNALISGISALE